MEVRTYLRHPRNLCHMIIEYKDSLVAVETSIVAPGITVALIIVVGGVENSALISAIPTSWVVH